MKRRTGKKIGKILLLVALLAIVGGIVYAVLTWPMYPGRAGAAGGCASLDPAGV